MMELLVFIGIAGAFFPLQLLCFALDNKEIGSIDDIKYHGRFPKI